MWRQSPKARGRDEGMIAMVGSPAACSLRVASVFQAWEKANSSVIGAVYACVGEGREGVKAEAQGSRQRVRQRIAAPSSLLEMCFDKAPLEEKRRIEAETGLGLGQGFVRRKHAARLVDEFLSAALLHRRARASNGTQLVVRPRPGAKSRTLWEPSRAPFAVFLHLVRSNGTGNLYLRRESVWDEVRHALYCLWLLNPALLAALLGVFLVGDVAWPLARDACKRLIAWLRARLSRRRRSAKSSDP